VVDLPPPHEAESWRKSSASGNSNCVEVALTDEHVWVRDTKDRRGPVLHFTAREWAAFVQGVRQGEFDLAAPAG
jgi:Domain of unknown function (DUF397)